jgi:serine/threonine protein kinase
MAFSLSPPMMVMDLMEDGNLRQYLSRNNWDQATGRRLLPDVASGMSYLHSFNILHGDLKSTNVLMDGTRAVITDFGLSRVLPSRTGSTAFKSPELLTNGNLDKPTDVYAYGMLCYEVVSNGRMPFEEYVNDAAVSLSFWTLKSRDR